MRIFISADMEGVTGVAARNHVDENHPEYQRFRRLMTEDVNQVIEGAMKAGATEFLVTDAHGPMTNVMIEHLHPAAQLMSGSNKPMGQMQGVDRDFAAVFLVGFHAREGSPDGFLNHTLMGQLVTRISCNGQEMGEVGLNAHMASHFGVPVTLVTGDDQVAEEARSLLGGDLETAVVKTSIDRTVAHCLPPAQSHPILRTAAQRAVEKTAVARPLEFEAPVRLEVTFKTTPQAHICSWFPTVERVDSKTIAITADTYPLAFQQMRACLMLSRTVM